MARFMVKASEYKNVCKAVNDKKLAELKKEIIEILKKQDEKEFKKAVDLFESQEMHYSHLEKSITGKWVEKAGYGVGTVRIWKGKKYKKIAPGKWARVFDKEGRGTNIAIGKLIAKVQKIDNVEDLMALVMANKQRFVDENGVDLPVLDKLRAAVDAKNNGGVGSKETSKPAEKTDGKYDKELVDSWKEDYKDFSTDALKEKIEEYTKVLERVKNDNPSPDQRVAVKQNEHRLKALNELLEEKKNKPAEKKEESEAEKTQNRSDAMKGNQNAKKYGLSDEQIEYYDIQEVVEDVNGYGIVKNSEGKYSYIDDGSVKNRPEDFEETIEKVKDRIEGAYQTKLNVEAAKAYDFENANFGKDVKVQKKSNGKYEFYKRDPNSTKGISVIVEVSNMREPFNMTYEVFDAKTGEGYQYDASYGNKEGLDWASERPEQMEKELKKFFKRDPNKEWEKQNTFEKEPSGLGTFTKIDDKTVEMPSNKASKQLFENLNKSRSSDKTRGFMTECYYDGENIVSTDGLRMTVVKAGDIGLEPGYVSVNTDGGKIRLERDEERTKENRFPNYKAVVSNNESSNQEVKLDNKALTEKLKEMKKEGKYSDNKSPQIALNFEDGKVMLDGVQIGTADGVKFDSDSQRMVVNAKFLKDALTSGDTSKVFVSSNPSKAMVVKTDVSESYVMPLRDNTMEVEYEKKTAETSEKPDIKSMSNDELKDYEAKLEKELLSMDRNSPGYADKYNQWREAHGENNERFHQGIEDEARAEKQRQSDAKAEKEKEIKEKYHGYFDSRSGLDKARDLKNLEKKFNFDGKVMSQKDFVEQAIDGGAEIKEREVNKLNYPSRTRWNRMNGYEQEQYERRIKEAGKKTLYSINGYEFPKSVVDYAKYYKENGKKGSGEEKSSLSDVAIKNRASSIASAVAYSKTYQEKMGAPFNMEVAESIIDDADDMDEPTKKAVREELKKLYSERKVQKSLDNQFLMDMFVEDEINELLAEKEQESLFDDYSAEQPGLFNSTAMKVQEAMNRCNIL